MPTWSPVWYMIRVYVCPSGPMVVIVNPCVLGAMHLTDCSCANVGKILISTRVAKRSFMDTSCHAIICKPAPQVDRYELRRATMLDMIKVAYNLDTDKVYDGPSWLDYDRFEVVAKTTPRTSPNATPHAPYLTCGPFGLVVKRGTELVPGYTCRRPKGTETEAGGCCRRCRLPVHRAGVLAGSPEERSILCHDVTMESFAATLGRALSSPVANFSVVNSTGLEGTWDLDLQYAEPPATATASKHPLVANEPPSSDWRLNRGKSTACPECRESERTASPNPPGASAALPPRP